MDVCKYQNWTKTYKYNNLNTYERNLKKGKFNRDFPYQIYHFLSFTLFRQKYNEYLNICIIKGMVEIYVIQNLTCNIQHIYLKFDQISHFRYKCYI